MSEAVLQVRDLSVRYGGVLALSSVSFDVADGQIVGLIGPNGAGKTTCIDALSGFTTPSARNPSFRYISFLGRSIDRLSPQSRVRLGFARTFQSLELFDDLTVRDNLRVAAATPTWISTLTDALWPKRKVDAAVDEVLELLGLDSFAEDRPEHLSNGQRHLVAVGRALVGRPKLLLLDEPAAGLNPSETVELSKLLRSLPDRGVSVLLVDHDMSLVLGVCDQVHVLDFGSIIASGTPEQIRSDPLVISAYLGQGSPMVGEPVVGEPAELGNSALDSSAPGAGSDS
jgi:branched-chain amino acid transport system ATP-binding protein